MAQILEGVRSRQAGDSTVSGNIEISYQYQEDQRDILDGAAPVLQILLLIIAGVLFIQGLRPLFDMKAEKKTPPRVGIIMIAIAAGLAAFAFFVLPIL